MSKEGWLFTAASPATVYHTGVVIMGQITLIEYDGTATVLDIEAGNTSIDSVMPSNHLILCHPLPSDGQSTGVSTSVLPMYIQG